MQRIFQKIIKRLMCSHIQADLKDLDKRTAIEFPDCMNTYGYLVTYQTFECTKCGKVFEKEICRVPIGKTYE